MQATVAVAVLRIEGSAWSRTSPCVKKESPSFCSAHCILCVQWGVSYFIKGPLVPSFKTVCVTAAGLSAASVGWLTNWRYNQGSRLSLPYHSSNLMALTHCCIPSVTRLNLTMILCKSFIPSIALPL